MANLQHKDFSDVFEFPACWPLIEYRTAWTSIWTNSCNNMPGFQIDSVVSDIFQILTEINLWIFRFEQEFINSLIRKYTKVEEKYFWTGLQDISHTGTYSWGAVDGEKNEAVTYTNWNSLQPGKHNNLKNVKMLSFYIQQALEHHVRGLQGWNKIVIQKSLYFWKTNQ